VLEAITKGLKQDGAVGNAAGDYKNQQAQKLMSKEKRELLIRDVVRHYAHLAHHPDPNIEFTEFNRHDAGLILGITSAILSKSDL
jgi:hypothetical protein